MLDVVNDVYAVQYDQYELLNATTMTTPILNVCVGNQTTYLSYRMVSIS